MKFFKQPEIFERIHPHTPKTKRTAPHAEAIAQNALEHLARKIKSEVDEAYHQGHVTEKSRRRG